MKLAIDQHYISRDSEVTPLLVQGNPKRLGTQSIFYKKLVTNHPCSFKHSLPSTDGQGYLQQSLYNKEGSSGIVSNPQIQIFSLLAGTGSFLFSNQKDLSDIREIRYV